MNKSTLHAHSSRLICFTPYGQSGEIGVSATVIGFNGIPFDTHANCYHLGQGYRAYFPRIMRFSSADRLSPFGPGGPNPYAYCNGDPVNYSDPQGTVGVPKAVQGFVRRSSASSNSGRITGNEQSRPTTDTDRRSVPIGALSIDDMKQAGVNLALKLRDHEPDLFNAVIKHLEPGDLHNAAPVHSVTGQKLREVVTPAYEAHLEGIINGQKRQYDHDARLTRRQIKALASVENALVNAYAPFTMEDSHKYYGGYHWYEGPSDAQFLITRANKLRNSNV